MVMELKEQVEGKLKQFNKLYAERMSELSTNTSGTLSPCGKLSCSSWDLNLDKKPMMVSKPIVLGKRKEPERVCQPAQIYHPTGPEKEDIGEFNS